MKFHLSCLRSSDQIPKISYCPTCRLLPEFKRNAKTRNAIEQDICNKALSLNSVCICNSKPRPGDRVLECHSEDCLNGKFFHLDCLKYKRCQITARVHGFVTAARKSPWSKWCELFHSSVRWKHYFFFNFFNSIYHLNFFNSTRSLWCQSWCWLFIYQR